MVHDSKEEPRTTSSTSSSANLAPLVTKIIRVWIGLPQQKQRITSAKIDSLAVTNPSSHIKLWNNQYPTTCQSQESSFKYQLNTTFQSLPVNKQPHEYRYILHDNLGDMLWEVCRDDFEGGKGIVIEQNNQVFYLFPPRVCWTGQRKPCFKDTCIDLLTSHSSCLLRICSK